jgi:hypothetical protein
MLLIFLLILLFNCLLFKYFIVFSWNLRLQPSASAFWIWNVYGEFDALFNENVNSFNWEMFFNRWRLFRWAVTSAFCLKYWLLKALVVLLNYCLIAYFLIVIVFQIFTLLFCCEKIPNWDIVFRRYLSWLFCVYVTVYLS